MKSSGRRNAFLLAMTLLGSATLAGCGDGKPYTDTSLTEATVSGVVTAKGEPVTKGIISFNPANSGRQVVRGPRRSGRAGIIRLRRIPGTTW